MADFPTCQRVVAAPPAAPLRHSLPGNGLLVSTLSVLFAAKVFTVKGAAGSDRGATRQPEERF